MKKLHQINFWKRLHFFVSDIQVNDPMSEEEKEMILSVAKEYQHTAKLACNTSLPSEEEITAWSNSKDDNYNSVKQNYIAVHNRCVGARWMKELIELCVSDEEIEKEMVKCAEGFPPYPIYWQGVLSKHLGNWMRGKLSNHSQEDSSEKHKQE